MIPTPHISAQKGAFAETVLMPGDPLRAKYIAEKFFENPELVNNVRGIQGYTGTYNGKRVSVMASGMGMPSIAIYSRELYEFYGVEKIIRVGSAGAVADGLKLRDVILAMGASTDSAFFNQYGLPGSFSAICDYDLLASAALSAQKHSVKPLIGNIVSSDRFYDELNGIAAWKKMGILAVEMETAALYATAARLGKKALAILTISDLPSSGEELSSAQRERSFDDMIKIALETA